MAKAPDVKLFPGDGEKSKPDSAARAKQLTMGRKPEGKAKVAEPFDDKE